VHPGARQGAAGILRIAVCGVTSYICDGNGKSALTAARQTVLRRPIPIAAPAAKSLPEAEGWLYELKLDEYRARVPIH
jgi:hypothetical protein